MPAKTAAKLLMKPEHRVLLMHPPAGYPQDLEPLPESVQILTLIEPGINLVLLFAEKRAVLDASLPQLALALGSQALFWIAYPKGGNKAGTDLNRDRLFEAMIPLGWTGVTLIALDSRWSAMRFRRTAE